MNIGFNNQVPWWVVAAILTPRGTAAKRLRDNASKAGKLSDATGGRRRRSMIVTEGGLVILSAVSTETLMNRLTQLSQTPTQLSQTPISRKGEPDDDQAVVD